MDYLSYAWFAIISALDEHNGAITAGATIVIAFFTIALACSTKRLWREAKLASRIALKSARAAKKGAEVAEKALLAQRATVYAENLGATRLIRKETQEVIGCVVQARWKNSGASNAVNINAGITFTVTDGVDVQTTIFSYSPIKQRDNITMGASASNITSNDTVSEADLRRIWEGRSRIFVLARVEYNDVFGMPHYTQACAEIKILTDPFLQHRAPDDAVFMTSIWREHNSSK